ncbi:hypothetical protein L1887_24601 [Cichorium endivia]|nr:hypothetical protein L1887_24601 [Cichorium endivia]
MFWKRLGFSSILLQVVGKGWASRSYFSGNGSTAIEIALKMAFRKFWVDNEVLLDISHDNTVESSIELKVRLFDLFAQSTVPHVTDVLSNLTIIEMWMLPSLKLPIMSAHPRRDTSEVPCIKRLCSWDCGLALDLAYLLQKLSIRFSYFTEQLPNDIEKS